MQTDPPVFSPSPASNGNWLDSYIASSTLAPQHEPRPQLNLAVIRGFFWRQKGIILGITAAVLLLALAVTLLMQPKYTAEASVRVDPETQSILEGQDSPIMRASDVSRYIETLADVIRSRATAYLVVDHLKLTSADTFMAKSGIDEKLDTTARREKAVEALLQGLKVDAPTDRRILNISFTFPDANLAASIANAYVSVFLADDMRRNFDKNDYARTFLLGQIGQTREKLQLAERQAIAYARSNRIVGSALLNSGSGESKEANATPQTITASNLADVNRNYTDIRAKRIAAEKRWQAVSKLNPQDLPEVQQSATIQSLASDRAKIAAQLAELQARYGMSYPQVQELTAELRTTDKQIAQTGNNIKSALLLDYQVAKNQEDALAQELQKVSEATLDEQDRRVNFNQLEREAGALRNQLQALLERYNQISAATNIQPGTMTKLDTAVVPAAPSSRNLGKNLLIALVLGIGLAGSVAFLKDILDDGLRSPEEVERKLGRRALGVTPLENDLELGVIGPIIDEAYVSIRYSIEFALPKLRHNVLQFTSSQAGEGKTTTAVIVARKFAHADQKVLLVDVDLRKPSIAARFNVKRKKQGVVEVILGKCSLEEALLDSGVANLDVLPVGDIPTDPPNVISSQYFRSFLESVRERYDIIILDSPPVIGLADSPLLSRYVDGVVFIVEANRTHHGQTKGAIRRLEDAGSKFLGVVLTKFISMTAGEGYSYQYQYYQYGQEA